ncbi:hypothetical protein CEXT_99331 [Caerostris extrusa]|uniref:Uncharacterized protein n=1 Tax=Caerostris extrusa TaxID=172846 RepID=A0AAV4XHZ1_CAEEX|nr:hypothetical protein CEXT_99331 [Caerostris extrusa]
MDLHHLQTLNLPDVFPCKPKLPRTQRCLRPNFLEKKRKEKKRKNPLLFEGVLFFVSVRSRGAYLDYTVIARAILETDSVELNFNNARTKSKQRTYGGT